MMKEAIRKATCPIVDFFLIRKRVWKFFIFPIIAALITGILLMYQNSVNINNEEYSSQLRASCQNFINTAITGISILTSFSLAVITIICSSDSDSIARLKDAHGDRKLYRPLKNSETTPTLFQVLLATVSYNVFSEIVFLAILFMQLFIVESYGIAVMSVVLLVNVFFIVHILCVLWSTIYALYFTYWK